MRARLVFIRVTSSNVTPMYGKILYIYTAVSPFCCGAFFFFFFVRQELVKKRYFFLRKNFSLFHGASVSATLDKDIGTVPGLVTMKLHAGVTHRMTRGAIAGILKRDG